MSYVFQFDHPYLETSTEPFVDICYHSDAQNEWLWTMISGLKLILWMTSTDLILLSVPNVIEAGTYYRL